MNPFGHIDLPVTDMEVALPFYEKLLTALGFTRTFHTDTWKVFTTRGQLPSAAYLALTEDPEHKPNGAVIGFWAESPADVNRLAALIEKNGGRITEGPKEFSFSDSYYAVFFEDPSGNRFEITYRID